MPETLEAAPMQTGASDPEYQAYAQRNTGPNIRPLPYEEWARYYRTPQSRDQSTEVPPTENSNQSNETPSSPGQINYNSGETQIVVSPNISPTFNNSPNINVGGNQAVNDSEASGAVHGVVAGAAAAGGEAPAAAPEQPEDPMDQLRHQLEEQFDQRLEEQRNQLEQQFNQRLEEQRNQFNQQLGEQRRQLEEQNRQLEERAQRAEERARRAEEENERLRRRIEELENPPPPAGPTPEEITQAYNNLENARTELAQLDIRRSARITDRFTGRRRADAEAYEQALGNYRTALEAAVQIIIAQERSQGASDEDIRRSLIQSKYDEDKTYAEKVVEINEDNFNSLTGWRRVLATGLRRYADLPTRYKIGLAVGLGAAVATASIMTGGGLAILAGGAAARFSLGLVNHQASLRNVSRHSLAQQLERIRQEQAEALDSVGAGPVDEYGRSLAEATAEERSANTRGNMRRNRRGAAIMVGGAALSAVGLAHLAGADVIPDNSWLGIYHSAASHLPILHHAVGHNLAPHSGAGAANLPPWASPWAHAGGAEHLSGGSNVGGIDMSHFRPDEFKAQNPHEAVKGMLGVIGRNHYQIHGASRQAMEAIAHDMEQHHWHIASGMEQGAGGHLRQNMVDVAKDWADGKTQNWNASAEQGLRGIKGQNSWSEFIKVANKHGVTFTRR